MLDFIEKISNGIPVGAAAVPIGLVLDLVLRLIPSEKPRGVLHLVGDLVKGLGKLFSKLGEASDQMLPQKLKSE